MSAGIGNAAMSTQDFLELCANGKPKEIEAAIKAGADVNAAIDDSFSNAELGGWTVLMLATADDSNLKVVELLLKSGAKVNVKNNENMWTVLGTAAAYNNPEVIALILKNGADINTKDEYDRTPLIRAAENNSNPEVISLLLKSGADARIKDSGGKRAIDFAGQNDNLKGTAAFTQLKKASGIKDKSARKNNSSNYELGRALGEEFAQEFLDALTTDSSSSKKSNSSDPSIFILTNTREYSAPSGYNIYDAVSNVYFGAGIRYVNISNPGKVRSGCKVKMSIKGDGAWIQTYEVDEDGRPGGLRYIGVVDATVID
jgi:hypothetical protein